MSRSLLVMLVLGACGRVAFDEQGVLVPRLSVTRADDRMAGPPTMSSLAELAPGTVRLSLREALTIANHRAGSDKIAFDASSLPAGTTITIGSELVIGGDGTRIDATDVAVTITGPIGYTGTLFQVKGTDAVIEGSRYKAEPMASRRWRWTESRCAMSRSRTHRMMIQFDGCSKVVIEDNRIERAGGAPVRLYATTDAWVQRNFVVLRAKMGSIHGFSLEEVSRSRFIDNIIDPGEAFLISLSNSSDNELIGNILDQGDTGITITGNSQRNLVFRNVVISPAYDSVFIESPKTDIGAVESY